MSRVPPGQAVVPRLQVFTWGQPPVVSLQSWRLALEGLVERPQELSWNEWRALPRRVVRADFHCVTGWSRLDNLWEGVLLDTLWGLVGLRTDARFLLVHCHGGYTTNLPLEALRGEASLLADTLDGRPLPPAHGAPVRLVVPGRYAYKSAKWVRSLELSAADRPGFWESHGYHPAADPWKEERFA